MARKAAADPLRLDERVHWLSENVSATNGITTLQGKEIEALQTRCLNLEQEIENLQETIQEIQDELEEQRASRERRRRGESPG